MSGRCAGFASVASLRVIQRRDYDPTYENILVISECFGVSAIRTSEIAVVGFSRFAVKANKSKLARTRRTDRRVIRHQGIKKKVINRAHTVSS
jgi:hypothetical protein